MGRIVEIVVGLNALGGIAVFLLGRRAAYKIKRKILRTPDPPPQGVNRDG